MTFWLVFWKVLLITALVAFALISIWVSIGGVADIKALLGRLENKSEED